MTDIAELIALAKEWPDDTPWGVRIREFAAALAEQAQEIEISNELRCFEVRQLKDELQKYDLRAKAALAAQAQEIEKLKAECETKFEELCREHDRAEAAEARVRELENHAQGAEGR